MIKWIYILTLWWITFPAVHAQQQLNGQNENVNLFVFVGQKISVIKLEQTPSIDWIIGLDGDSAKIVNVTFDQGFIAKYKIITNVFNKLELDTIEFKAFDHYGRPAFEKTKFVMLYLSYSEEDSSFYHQKYQFDEVKKTKGIWIGKNGKSLKELFDIKKNGVFKNRGIF